MEIGKSEQNVMNLFSDQKLVKICAPMVRYSKLQFRALVRKYNCDLCFTPMILADSFCQSEKARNNEFSTNLGDTPVIVQFAANKVHDFVGASHLVSPYCSGVDLNCGCPQRWAKNQGIGCIMLENPETIYDLVRQCRNHISKPFSISVKMRILPDLKKTVSICQQLENCRISFLTVHARTANQHSVGDVNVDALKIISQSVNCPVVASGGVRTLDEALDLQERSKCKGVMAASGLLTNPALFSGTTLTPLDCVQNWVNICYNSTLDKNSIYFQNNTTNLTAPKFLQKNKKVTFQCFHHHLVFMLEKILTKSSRKIFNSLQSFDSVLQFLYNEFNIKPNLFPIEEFNLCDSLSLSYENQNKMYLELRQAPENFDFVYDTTYNSNFTDGSFFNSRKSINDSDTCIPLLFLDE